MFSSYLLLCSVFYLDLCPVYLSGRTPPAFQLRRGTGQSPVSSLTHEASMHVQPNMALLKTNIRDTVFIIRLSLFRRTTPVPESTVNAENTNGRGPWASSECSFFINYLSTSSRSDPAKLVSLPYPYSVFNGYGYRPQPMIPYYS